MNEPLHPIIAAALDKVAPKAREVYEAFRSGEPMTDDELVIASGISKGTSSPRRTDLVRAGLIEQVGVVEVPGRKPIKRWGAVPAERVAEASETAKNQGKRVRPITDYPLDVRVEVVRALLAMDDVNTAIQGTSGKGWSRARGRSQDQRGERERFRRENARQIREAENRGSPVAEFYKLRRALLESGDKVRAVRRLVEEELDRRSDDPARAIGVTAWPEVAALLADLEAEARDCGERIRETLGPIDGDVIEATAVDVDTFVFELIEGGDAS